MGKLWKTIRVIFTDVQASLEQLNNYFRQITVSKLTTTWPKALAERITSPLGNRGVNHNQQKNTVERFLF